MRSRKLVWKSLLGSALAGGLVLAGHDIPSQTASPGSRIPPVRDDLSPYPMNYTDEAAQSLGISHGEMDILSPASRHNPGLQLRGGIDHGIPEFKLQWPSN
jgi:hypothetical protein